MAYGRRGAFRRLPPLGEHRMERKVMRQYPKSAESNVAQNQSVHLLLLQIETDSETNLIMIDSPISGQIHHLGRT